jgi:hypothetical protein
MEDQDGEIRRKRNAEFALNHVGFRAAMHPTWCMAELGVWSKILL